MGPDFVLKVNFRGDAGRLAREARVLALAPSAARTPRLETHGVTEGLEYSLLARVPGVPLSRAWPDLPVPSRRESVRQLAGALAALHRMDHPELPGERDLAGPHVLPLDRLHEQVTALEPVLGTAWGERLRAWLGPRAAALAPGEEVLAHGDPHLENVLWDEGHGLTLLDLEWSRRSLAEVDLEILAHFFREPARFVSPEDQARAQPEDYAEALEWLREDYPGLFAHPQRETRLAVLGVSRQLGFLVDQLPAPSPARLADLARAIAS